MQESPPKPAVVFTLRAALEQAGQTARDQLAAAWQLQVERAHEQLAAGWGEHLDRVFRERFEDLSSELEAKIQHAVNERVRSSVEAAVTLAKDLSRRELTEVLNRNARHFSQAENFGEFGTVVLEAVAEFCERAVLLGVTPHHYRFEASKPASENLQSQLGGKEFYLRDAAALANAVESKDTVVAMKRPGELGESLAAALGTHAPEEGKVYLFPVAARLGSAASSVVALVLAEGDDFPVDVNAMELLCSLAGAAFDSRHTAKPAAASTLPAGLVSISLPPKSDGAPDWSALSRADQDLHLRAQRFARVQVAEMRLYKSDQVKRGRAERNLYDCLREDIERSRESYREQYLASCASMVDYLHLEIVKTLANDDGSLLGPDYPGPLG